MVTSLAFEARNGSSNLSPRATINAACAAERMTMESRTTRGIGEDLTRAVELDKTTLSGYYGELTKRFEAATNPRQVGEIAVLLGRVNFELDQRKLEELDDKASVEAGFDELLAEHASA